MTDIEVGDRSPEAECNDIGTSAIPETKRKATYAASRNLHCSINTDLRRAERQYHTGVVSLNRLMTQHSAQMKQAERLIGAADNQLGDTESLAQHRRLKKKCDHSLNPQSPSLCV